MFVSTVTCRFDLHRGTFDDTPLRAVSWDKDLLSVRDHFFVVGDVPHLAFVLVYRLVPPSHPDGTSGRSPYPPAYPAAWPGPWPPGPAWPAQAGSGPGGPGAGPAAPPTPKPTHGPRLPAPRDGPPGPHAGNAGPGGSGPPRTQTDDLREALAPDVRARFDRLRAWRSGRAQDEAVPAYVVLTNRQLLELASRGPTTRAGLEQIHGLGRRKLERYAKELLAVLGAPQPAPAADGAPPTEPAPDPSAQPDVASDQAVRRSTASASSAAGSSEDAPPRAPAPALPSTSTSEAQDADDGAVDDGDPAPTSAREAPEPTDGGS